MNLFMFLFCQKYFKLHILNYKANYLEIPFFMHTLSHEVHTSYHFEKYFKQICEHKLFENNGKLKLYIARII